MWNYEKRLQYPVNIKTPNAKIAQVILTQYGGPDGEMGASMRYLSQRFTMPNRMAMGTLNDVGTEASELYQKSLYFFSLSRESDFPSKIRLAFSYISREIIGS